MRNLLLTAIAACLTAAPPALADAAAGKAVFQAKCAVCHAAVEGQAKLGPSLWGVVGRKAGTLPGYQYSPAMLAYGKVWDASTLDPYLAHPSAVVPGTRMPFGGLPDPADRANLIAYLTTLK